MGPRAGVPATRGCGHVGARGGGSARAQDYDLLIRDARVVDGSGAPWFRADVGVRGDTIAAVAPRLAGTARRVIEAGGRVAAPGFIDLHSHARGGHLRTARRGELRAPGRHDARRRAGRLVAAAARRLPRQARGAPPGVNLGELRRARLRPRARWSATADRSPTPEELERMRELVAAGDARRARSASARASSTSPAASRAPTRWWRWRASPASSAASTSRTCATRRRASSTASARRSRSASRAGSRRRSRTTR